MSQRRDPAAAFDRPIVVIGSARSGTSMIGRVLSSHPDAAYLVEPRLTWRFGNDKRSDALGPEHARPEVIRHVRGRFHRFLAEQGKPRLVEKTPSNALRVAFVDRVLPECKFVHVYRHGLDAVLAIDELTERHAEGVTGLAKGRWVQRLREAGPRRLPHYAKEAARRVAPPSIRGWLGPAPWGPRIPGLADLQRELTPLEVAALQWRYCVELAVHDLARVPAERVFEVRLEGLNESKILEMLDFCELDDPACREAFTSSFDPGRLHRRRDQAGEENRRRINKWIGGTLLSLGYRPPHAAPAAGEASPATPPD